MQKRSLVMALLCLIFVFQTVSADPSVNADLTYDGSPQQLVSDSDQTGGFYSSDGGITWGGEGEIPEKTEAGSWDILRKAAETEEGTFIGTAVIAPKELAVNWPADTECTYTFNGEEQYPDPEVEGIISGDDCSVIISGKQTDAGIYTAAAEITGTAAANYKLPEESTCEYTIEPKELVVTWGETSLQYNGTAQLPKVTVTECLENDSSICENPTLKGSAADAGTGYIASVSISSPNYLIIEEDRTIDFEILPITAVIEWGETVLTYNGEMQAPTASVANAADAVTAEVEGQETDAGTGYTAEVTALSSGNYVLPEDDSVRTAFSIEPASLSSALISFEPQRALYYDGSELDISITVVFNGTELTEGTDYVISENSVLSGTEPGIYPITVRAVGEDEKEAYGTNYTGSAASYWMILDPEDFRIYQVGEEEEHIQSFCNGECSLPATGFSSRSSNPNSVRNAGTGYVDLKMRLQIPVLNIDTELTGVRGGNGSWDVEGLGERAGLLNGSYMPGQGLSVVAGHNTLSETEAGPFMQLLTLDNNDVIFINSPEGSLLRFSVYANELIGADEMNKLTALAEQEPGTLALVTCENESSDGGYLNRRVVLARPLY